MSPALALQKAALAALRADTAVQAVVGARVWDERPQDAAYPHLVISRSEARPWGGVEGEGQEHALTLTCLSRFGGAEEAHAALAAAREALHGASLALEGGWRLVNLRATYADVFRASDRRTTAGVLRLRAVTEAG